MTPRRITSRRINLERKQSQVMALIASGATGPEVATTFKVTREAVWQFRRRHADDIATLEAEVAAGMKGMAQAHKANRIAELDALYAGALAWLEEHGYSERVERFDRQGNLVGATTRFRADAVNALRGLLAAIAEELGERKTTGDTTNIAAVVNIIRGGTPLGMTPPTVDSLIVEAEARLLPPPEDDNADGSR